MTPAVVVSGHTMALGVVRALAIAGIPVHVVHYEPRHFAQLSRYARKTFRSPHPESQEAAFVDFMLGEVGKLGPSVLFPVADEAVVAVSRNKEVLASSFIVACSDWNVAQQFIDKALTYDIAEKAGIPIPKTISPRSLTEAKECEEQIVYPCLVKPRQSHLFYEHFKKKSFVAANSEEMIAAFKRASEVGLEVSLQEIIPGSDSLVVNFNCYAIEGVTVAEFTAEHTRNGPPFFGSPRVALSKVIPEVFEPGRRLMKAMNYDGYACTEFKQDPRDGAYKLMEVNGRHNLSTLLAVGCGLNFPYIEYRHRVYGDIPSVSNFRHGIYWTDFFRDVGFSVRHRRREGYTLRQYIDPYLKHHIDAIIDLKDPLPLLGRLQGLALEWARGRL